MSVFRRLYADVQDVGDSPADVSRLLRATTTDDEVRAELTRLESYH